MALIVLSKKYFDTNGGGDLGFIVNSIDGVNFSLEKDCVCGGRHNEEYSFCWASR